MGTIYIVTSNNDHRKLEALHVRVYKHLSGGLARGVRISWGEDTSLQQVIVIVFHLPIDLISRDMDEASDSNFLCTLQHDMSAVHIGVCESIRVAKAQVDM